ncbi:MAG: hypothetical protein QM831_30435 [Kofleriaceae bacterium]
MRFELHCHTTESDGTDTPAGVVARGAARDLALFAITDHDTCTPGGGIRGVEISCDHPNGRTIHVLAYDRGGEWSVIENRLGALREARRNRLRVMQVKLEVRGIKIDIEPLLASGRAVGRPDLARLMIAGGYVTSMKEAFTRHLYDGGPVDVPHHALPLADAIQLGRDAGAAMVLAHPHLYDHMGVEMIKQYKLGVEAFYGAYDARERARWIELADSISVVCTGGSDSHSADEQLGVEIPDDRGERILEWMSAR